MNPTPVVAPAADDVRAAAAALDGLGAALHSRRPVTVSVAGNPRSVALPQVAAAALEEILASLAKGHSVALVSTGTEMTTQQAADTLQVSRPFLIGLLDAGEIGYRMVGTHRRVRTDSLLAYMERDGAARAAAADELSAEAHALGLA
ncbi:MAG: helix-turn-helix domain-containing protein [Bifidobacteriaceae bacterium]|nr:helix-turn-helix domain-containing protein [Bifidobacteriaceae bacterium]